MNRGKLARLGIAMVLELGGLALLALVDWKAAAGAFALLTGHNIARES
jgi:hypothetical protein